MTARARITQAELVQAATLAKAEGVVVTITAPNGKTYTIAPALDGLPVQAHGGPVSNRAGANSCDEAFGGRS